MKLPAHAAVSFAILLVLSSSGCSLLFDETTGTAAGDAGTALDANSPDPDALMSCSPHSCVPPTLRLYHFDGVQDRLVDECGESPLISDANLAGAMSAFSSLGDAAKLTISSQAYASDIKVSGSWTLDFWIRPRDNPTGEVLFLRETGSVVCGFKLVKTDGQLQLLKSINGADSAVANVAIADGQWQHVELRYDQTAASAAVYLLVDRTEVGPIDVETCDNMNATLILGNSVATTDNMSVEAEIDELRLQNEALPAAACAPE